MVHCEDLEMAEQAMLKIKSIDFPKTAFKVESSPNTNGRLHIDLSEQLFKKYNGDESSSKKILYNVEKAFADNLENNILKMMKQTGDHDPTHYSLDCEREANEDGTSQKLKIFVKYTPKGKQPCRNFGKIDIKQF